MNNLLVLRAGHVFDGERSIGQASVLIQDGQVRDVDTSGAEVPAGAEVIDFGPDASMLPGLIDAHVHLAFDASADVVTSLTACDDDALLDQMEVAAKRMLRSGVTTVRDLGDRNYLSLSLAERSRATGGAIIPDIVAAGPPITSSGGHCHFLGGEAEGAAALLAAVQERAGRGCEVVKVMVSGGNLTPGSRPHESQYDLAALRIVVDAAREAGLRTAAHVHGARAVTDAVEAGFDTLEHVTFFTADGVQPEPGMLDRIAARDMVVSVTVGLMPGAPEPPPAMRQRLADIVANHGRMFRAGATMVPGTDAGVNPAKPHDVMPYALRALVDQVGMTPQQALRAATSVAAKAVGRGSKGRIAAGADADVLVVQGNALADMTAVTNVSAVFKGGIRIR
ncbi:MAG TPA: amidohydrolase family protein [Streptosporangiaceae bacterium]